ncbi:hypothetical protein GXB78_27495 [Pseudomonas moraviensis subsp. stanleyae]|nr:hypothetical protein [Pseudomonas moraviensis subsp. stanleyae]
MVYLHCALDKYNRQVPFKGPVAILHSAYNSRCLCAWLKDKFGMSWQAIHVGFLQVLQDPDTRKSQRAMQAMFQMKKLDVAALQRAFDGQS